MKTSVFGKFKFRSFGTLSLLILLLGFGGLIFLTKPSPIMKKGMSSFDIPVEILRSKDYLRFGDYARKNGAKGAYEALKSYFKNNEPEAHDFAHVVGNVAVELNDIDGIKICDNFYNYGCYHGFMQIYLQKHGLEAVVDMERSCNSLGAVNAPSCLHGIGHGLMMEAYYDLSAALKNCGLLEVASRTYCYDGVFMERIAGSMLPAEKKLVISFDNLLEPCKTMAKMYMRECWRNQVAVWFSFFSGDSYKVGSYCASLSQDYWQICFESIGLLNVQNYGDDLNRLIKSCEIVNSRGHDFCLTGEVKELLFEGKIPEKARSLCFYVTFDFRKSCFDTYEQMFAEYKVRFGLLN